MPVADTCGVPLLVRLPRGVRLTPAAKALLPHIEAALGETIADHCHGEVGAAPDIARRSAQLLRQRKPEMPGRIGLSAHDLATALGAQEVLLVTLQLTFWSIILGSIAVLLALLVHGRISPAILFATWAGGCLITALILWPDLNA